VSLRSDLLISSLLLRVDIYFLGCFRHEKHRHIDRACYRAPLQLTTRGELARDIDAIGENGGGTRKLETSRDKSSGLRLDGWSIVATR